MRYFRGILTLVGIFVLTITASAQHQYVLKGNVLDRQSGEGLEYATVRIMVHKDSMMISGTNTDEVGNFMLRVQKPGKYVLRLSYLGYRSIYQEVKIAPDSPDTIQLGSLVMYSDDYVLRTAVVQAAVAKVQQVGDTTMFNADAYRTPEGATLEALVKQLPGAEVADDGSITINGKKVNEVLVNGKDFFKGDTETAMKNLPVNLVKKLKTYDKKSDYAEQTGIDDGEDSFVLDIMTKRELNQSWISNMDFAGGMDYDDLRGLYSGKIFVTRFTDRTRVTLIGSHNNVGDNGFGGMRGFGGNNGLTTSTMLAGDFSWENRKQRFEAGRVELGGNVRYSRRDNETESTNATETFLTSKSQRRSFSDSHNWGNALSQNVNTSFRFQWAPDSLTNVSFRPSYSWSKSRNRSNSLSAQFDKQEDDTQDYYFEHDEVDDVLSHHFNLNTRRDTTTVGYEDFLVNLRDNLSRSQNHNHNVNGSLSITRRLTGKAGRNVSLNANGGWNRSHSENYSLANVVSRQGTPGAYDHTSKNSTHQYTTTPSVNWNMRVGGSYVEPLAHKLYAEFRYNYSYRFQDQKRTLFNLYDPHDTGLSELVSKYNGFYKPESNRTGSIYGEDYRSTTDLLNEFLTLNEEDVLAAIRDEQNSQYATYRYNNHSANVGLRYNEGSIRLNAGLSFNPEHTIMDYKRGDIDTRVTRTVFNVSPQVRFRWNMNRTRRVELNFNANSSQPSMTNLLEVVDTSDPMRVSTGNAGLKPSWTNSLRASFNDYNTNRQQSWAVNYAFSHTRNSISTLSVHDLTSGRTFSAPQNITGNWNTSGGLTFNSGLGAAKLWNVSTSTNMRFNHSTAYVATDSDVALPSEITSGGLADYFRGVKEYVKTSVGKTTNLTERLSLTYRKTFWDVSASGRVVYQHSHSSLQSRGNMDTWGFDYGLAANMTLNCGFALSTDIRMNSRRGYATAAMNTNELLWNAQISQSFLKDKSLTVSLQFYDLLRQQDNISRNITATMRSDSWNMGLNSYCMLHVIYKFKAFAGQKDAEHEPQPGRAPQGGGADEPRRIMQGSMPPHDMPMGRGGRM